MMRGIVPLPWFVLAAFLLFGTAADTYELRQARSGDTIRWKESCLHYSVHESGYPGLEDEKLREIIRASFDAWEDVSCSYFYFEETAPASCDALGFNENSGNINLLIFRTEGWLFDGTRGASDVALTTTSWDDSNGRLLDADMEFNADIFQFSIDESLTAFDLQNTATHEIGHMLGVDESFVSNATMYGSAAAGEIQKRTLESDDIAAVCALYPTTEDPGVCLPPHCGLDLSCSSTECSSPGVANPPSYDDSCSVLAPAAKASRFLNFKFVKAVLTFDG